MENRTLTAPGPSRAGLLNLGNRRDSRDSHPAGREASRLTDPHGTHPALLKSLVHVRRRIAAGEWSAGDRLPPIRDLARQARAGAAAMCAALGVLRDEGVLTIVRNRGAYLGSPPERPEPRGGAHAPDSRRWQRLRVQIAKDIFDGAYPPGEPMPSLRDLQAAYAVSYKTLRKALEDVAAEGVIVPHKKTYRVPPLRRGHGTVVFVGAPEASSKISFGGYPVTEFLSSLRREGGKSLINAAVVSFDPDRRKSSLANQLKALADTRGVLGYVLWTSMLPERKLDQALEALREAQRPAGGAARGQERPVAVVDTTWDMGVTNALRHRSELAGWAFRVFTVAGQAAGRMLGQHLLRLGHRKVAYFSYCHRELWSQARWRGLHQAFQGAGLGAGARRFVLEEMDDRAQALTGPEDVEGFRRDAEAFLAAAGRAGQGYHAGYALEQMAGSVRSYIHQLNMAARVEPLLAEASREGGFTAWVGANDRMALLARDHLAKKGVRVPREVSVAGFDDSKSAVDNDLTSYSFGFADIARKVLGHVLSPRRRDPAAGEGPVECEGLLVERGSTGPAKP